MKVKFLLTGFLILVSLTTFAQKGELSNAKDKYTSYDVERANKLTMVQGNQDLNDAQKSIDKASLNEKTSALPLTWALKGAIYSALALRDTVPATSLPLFTTADDALKQAKVLDSVKHENKDLIHNAYLNLAQYQFNLGRTEFQDKKYAQAYKSFDYFRSVLPDDTLSMYVTGLAAANEAMTSDPKYYPLAIASYTKLLGTNYTQNNQTYNDLTTLYLYDKDTTNAFKVAGEGVAKYPTDNALRRREIEIGLQSGKQSELVSKIETAIASDPKNKTLYYYEGLTYSQMGDDITTQQAKTKDLDAKKALEQKKLDLYAKAAIQFKKALDIDPDYFDANLSMGYVSIEPAFFDFNTANQLPGTNAAQKQYDLLMAKSATEADIAGPYLLKAVSLNPKSEPALTNLKNYYFVKKDMVNANKIQKQIEALPAN